MTLQTLEATVNFFLAMRRDGSTAIVFANPRPCAVCGQFHCFFVNRLGSTCCISCDHERSAATPACPEPAERGCAEGAS